MAPITEIITDWLCENPEYDWDGWHEKHGEWDEPSEGERSPTVPEQERLPGDWESEPDLLNRGPSSPYDPGVGQRF